MFIIFTLTGYIHCVLPHMISSTMLLLPATLAVFSHVCHVRSRVSCLTTFHIRSCVMYGHILCWVTCSISNHVPYRIIYVVSDHIGLHVSCLTICHVGLHMLCLVMCHVRQCVVLGHICHIQLSAIGWGHVGLVCYVSIN